MEAPETFSDGEVKDYNYYFKIFESVYAEYASKAFGFILLYTPSKEKAEELLIITFLQVWANIKTFETNQEKKVMHILLSACKSFKHNRTILK